MYRLYYNIRLSLYGIMYLMTVHQKLCVQFLWLNRNSMGDASCFQWKQPHDNNATKTQGLIRLTNKWTNTDTALFFFHPSHSDEEEPEEEDWTRAVEWAGHCTTFRKRKKTATSLRSWECHLQGMSLCLCVFQALKKNKRWGIPWARRTNWAHIGFLLALS